MHYEILIAEKFDRVNVPPIPTKCQFPFIVIHFQRKQRVSKSNFEFLNFEVYQFLESSAAVFLSKYF